MLPLREDGHPGSPLVRVALRTGKIWLTHRAAGEAGDDRRKQGDAESMARHGQCGAPWPLHASSQGARGESCLP